MEQSTVEKAATIVVNEAKQVKTELGILPGGLVIGLGVGFLAKGFVGAVVGGVLGSVIYKLYHDNLNKQK